MKPTILLFHIEDNNLKSRIRSALFPLHVRMKVLSDEDGRLPFGVILGLPPDPKRLSEGSGRPSPDIPAAPESAEDAEPMILFAGLSDAALSSALAALRKKHASIPYKAVLTPVNQYWNAYQCLTELKKEHAAMHGQPE